MARLAGCSALEDKESPSSSPKGVGDDRTLKPFDELDNRDIHVGSLSADPDVTNGSQSAWTEIGDEGRGVIAHRFSEPIDLSGTHLVPVLESTVPHLPRVQLINEASDLVDLRMKLRAENPLQPYDFGVESTNGTPQQERNDKSTVIIDTALPSHINTDVLKDR